ncbi:MAG: type VI secretion system tip protein TssI/VgrG [Neisseria sp.]|uniref:type VI secretion system Vgr family protein n=1 Tax=Neisseria sp. TaxID=192066 RepID=UPI0026DCDC6D|nr:type VI secretion system tip protein TssI/VgrG [Neisseria sp.]MDO4641978.1 type VI secretion system tip protein TssI/VgrG [Neisseria sp.]
MNRTVIAQTPFGQNLLFKKLDGKESVSDLFEFNVTFVSKDANLQGSDIVGLPVTLEIDTKTGGKRYLNGLVTDFGYFGEDEDEEDYHAYTAVLRPFMWYLTQNVDSRVFVDKSVLDITKEVLAPFGFPFQIKCQKGYRTRGFCVQYQETSFNFISRLFEQEGIYYYFDHKNDSHELVITDDVGSLTAIAGNPALPYHSRQVAAGAPSIEYIDEWAERDSLKSNKYSTQDYNYNNAKVAMKSSDSVHDFNSVDMEHYDFYTGFSDVSEAQNYSQVRSESLKSQTKVITGSGTVLTLAPGHTFSLIKHPHASSNSEYLILATEYAFEEAGYTTGDKIGSFRTSFRVLPKSFPYRPPLRAMKPQVLGTQAATVTGPAGEEVYTNEYGDIKVQFHWDRYGKMNESSSNWVRVAQGSAGSGFGSINTPRVGEEVLVDFINGDADRPIIVGRLYNSAMSPPWGFPAAAKQSGIKSKSFNSPLANFNELMFNDTAGSEMVNFQAQKDLTSLVKNNETRNVNNDRTTTIGNNETLSVTGERAKSVQKNETASVAMNRTASVGQNETLDVTQNQALSVGQNQSVSVGKDQSVSVTNNRSKSVGQNESVSVGQSQAMMIGQDQNVSVGKNQALTVGASRNKTIVANEVSSIGGNRQKTVSSTNISTIGAANVTNIGGADVTNVGGLSMTNVGGAETHIVGGAIALASGLHASMRSMMNTTIAAGHKVTLRVGGSEIVMSRGEISISAKKITINGKRVVSLDGNKIHLN